jgi:hypothetical protein
MRTVRCVSPHGGARHGLRADNEQPARPGYQGALLLEPAEGGWVWNPLLGHVRVGDEAEAPDAPDFIADGFHFVNADGGPDVCAAAGDGCWCGQHRAPTEAQFTQAVQAARQQGLAPADLAQLLGTENT